MKDAVSEAWRRLYKKSPTDTAIIFRHVTLMWENMASDFRDEASKLERAVEEVREDFLEMLANKGKQQSRRGK